MEVYEREDKEEDYRIKMRKSNYNNKEYLEKRIRGLYKRHIEKNGFPVCRCVYATCYYKRKIKELKQRLKLRKETK